MSEEICLDLTLSYQETKELVKIAILNKEPIMLWGMPGIGKSDMIREIGLELDRPVIDIRASLFSEVDIKGYPYINKETGTMKFALSNEFPRDPDSNAIVFLDELPAALPSTQLALYQLILDRKIGEYELPENVTILAAGNRDADRAGTFEMPKPLQNRFIHVEIDIVFDEWLIWAVDNNINKDVISFLNKNKDKLLDFRPESPSKAFATPRSWVKSSKLLNSGNYNNDQVRNIVSGCVGGGLAAEFIGFKEIVDKLPDAMDILERKVTKIDKDLKSEIVYAVITNLLYKLREVVPDKEDKDIVKKKEKWDEYANNFFKYMMDNDSTIGPEFVAMAASLGFNVYKLPFNAKKTKSMMVAIKKYQILLADI